MKIKADKIGTVTTSPLGGVIKVKAEHAAMFHRAGRYDLLEGVDESTGNLKPLSKMSKSELQALAKGKKGYKSSLNMKQLIKLIEG